MIDTQMEYKMSKLADDVMRIAGEDGNLNDAIAKIAGENELNDHQIREICARTNHLKNAKLVEKSRLETFDIATFDKVSAIMDKDSGEIEKEASEENDTILHVYDVDNDKTYAYSINKGAAIDAPQQQMEKAPAMQEDDGSMQQLTDENRELVRNQLMGKQDGVNEETLNTQEAVVENMDSIKQISKQLITDGEPFEEVIAILKTTLLRNTPQLQDFIIADLASQLLSEGVITEEEAASATDVEPYDETGTEEGPLDKAANDLVGNVEKIALLAQIEAELVEETINKFGEHLVRPSIRLRHKTATEDVLNMMKLGSEISKSSDMEKVANAFGNFVSHAAAPIISSGSPNTMKDLLLKYLPTAILASATFHGITRGLDATEEAIRSKRISSKAEKLRKDLPERYSDLKKIDPVLYNDLFDTLTTTTPELVKTPYALYQLIRGQAEMQAMDPRVLHTIGNIDIGERKSSGGKSNLEGINTAMSAITGPLNTGIKIEGMK